VPFVVKEQDRLWLHWQFQLAQNGPNVAEVVKLGIHSILQVAWFQFLKLWEPKWSWSIVQFHRDCHVTTYAYILITLLHLLSFPDAQDTFSFLLDKHWTYPGFPKLSDSISGPATWILHDLTHLL
jgi:hypothetical protein